MTLDDHDIGRLHKFKFNFNCTDALFYKSKINSHVVFVTNKKQERNISFKSNNRRCTTLTSYVNSSKSNDPNTYNNDIVAGNSNLPHVNVHTKHSSNNLITLQKETNIESINSINEENKDANNASE